MVHWWWKTDHKQVHSLIMPTRVDCNIRTVVVVAAAVVHFSQTIKLAHDTTGRKEGTHGSS